MNFLAHFYVAELRNERYVGHFLGDFVKGSRLTGYSAPVRQGILMHRKTDSFADAHAVTRASRQRFSPRLRRFAGVMVDLCYDHFLARHWRELGCGKLKEFTKKVYGQLEKDSHLLTNDQKQVAARMIELDWLCRYADIHVVGKALDRIAGRLTRGDAFMGSISEITANYQALETDFKTFFPDLTNFSAKTEYRI